MENSLHDKKKIPNYVLVSIALVQSEIFWFYSVLYYIFRESGLVNEHENSSAKTTRNRSHSAPPTSKPFTRKDFVILNNVIVEEDEEEDEEENFIQRRYSLPNEYDTSIRERPSVEDELVGTTCPPVIWQKLRVKLGRPPVHGDPKPKSMHSTSPSPSPSPPALKTSTTTSSTSSIERIESYSPSISANSTTESMYSQPVESSSHSLSKSSTNSSLCDETSSISPSTQQKKFTKKRIISKLNSAFHLHRTRSSTDLSKTNTL